MIGEGKDSRSFPIRVTKDDSFMKELKADSLEDIIAGISLYRPGPMAEIPNYIEGERKILIGLNMLLQNLKIS